MGYAFISYSSKNQTSADAMRALFKKHNIDTWMAPYDIPAGSEYAEVLYDALTGCSCLVLMLTDVSQNSQWVKKEVNIAITNGKTVIPVKLEDVELNSSMKLYLNDQQIVPVHVIEEKSIEIQNILHSVIGFTGENSVASFVSEEIPNEETTFESTPKKIELTVWSPVNTDVYLNNKKHLVMKIDHNSGFNYKCNSINVFGEFELIFVSKGFEKAVAFDADSIEDKLDYHLEAILNKKEIASSYDRDEAIEQIKEEGTAYAYKQIGAVGTTEDIQLLLAELKKHLNTVSKNQSTDYLVATCVSALGKLAVKFGKLEDVKIILEVYDNYEAKASYGYMFEPIVKRLLEEDCLNESNIADVNSEKERKIAFLEKMRKSVDEYGDLRIICVVDYDYLGSINRNRISVLNGVLKSIDDFAESVGRDVVEIFSLENLNRESPYLKNENEEFILIFFINGCLTDSYKKQLDMLVKSDFYKNAEKYVINMEKDIDDSISSMFSDSDHIYYVDTQNIFDVMYEILSIAIENFLLKLKETNCDELIESQKDSIGYINNEVQKSGATAEVPYSLNECCDEEFHVTSEKNDDELSSMDESELQVPTSVEAEGNNNTDQIANTSTKEKYKGHLVSSYRRIKDISKEDCENPIKISMMDGTTKFFDFCDEFPVSNQKKYIVVSQKNDSNECLFFVFRKRKGKTTLISEGQEQKKIYRWFRKNHSDKYIFTDEKVVIQEEKKHKHFAQDTAAKYFATADDITQILTLPQKYGHISSNAFAKLVPNNKEIKEIIISDSVEVIEDSAFAGLIVTDAVFIPYSVRKIGYNAFTLKKGAYVYCEKNSIAYQHYIDSGVRIIEDVPFKSKSVDLWIILYELYHNKEATRISRFSFFSLSSNSEIDEVIIPDGIRVIDSFAFENVKIKNKIVIPSSVIMIGSYALNLMPGAYVECDEDSYAYFYCRKNNIKNSVDMSNYYRSKGVCAYCGGNFTGLLYKRCSVCHRKKNY